MALLKERWQVQLLGELCVRRGKKEIWDFSTRRTAALLAYLVLESQSPHPRDALIDLIWPGRELKNGIESFRVALSWLRRLFEPPGTPRGSILHYDKRDKSVLLNPDAVTSDVAQFQAFLRSAERCSSDAARLDRLKAAVDLYRGPFLNGYHTLRPEESTPSTEDREGQEWEAWVLKKRDRLDDAFQGALHGLVRLHRLARNYPEALDCAHRLLEQNPLHEAAHRELIHIYFALGQPIKGEEQYAELVRLLAEEQLEPSAATRLRIGKLRDGWSGVPGVSGGPSREQSAGEAPPSAAGSPPAPISPPAVVPRDHLPVPLTRFFGREEEIAQLSEMLQPRSERRQRGVADERRPPSGQGFGQLLSVTGPGGYGKTRLAVEVAKRVREAYPGGAFFVPLADLSDWRLIPNAVLDAMQVPADPLREPLAQAVDALSGPPALLIFDNMEHLVAGGAAVVQALLERSPSLACLVTSRHRLFLPVEQEYPLDPLPTSVGEGVGEEVPGKAVSQEAERFAGLADLACVQLFEDRARAVQSRFRLSRQNLPAVVRLCRQLEGSPLAIELAAAQSRILSPTQIGEQICRSLAVLVDRRASPESRHRSLMATIAWSFRLLPAELQRFFAQLSVFRGGWSLEAAEAVCEAPYAVAYLSQLSAHSLLLLEDGAPSMRYQLAETLREFAAEQLTPRDAAPLARRHAEFFLALAEEARPHLSGPEQGVWLERLTREQSNLRVALDGLSETGTAELGLRLAAALTRFWYMRGHLAEGRESLERLLNLEGAARYPSSRADALNGVGTLAYNQGDYATARQRVEESLAIHRALGDRPSIANALNDLGLIMEAQAEYATARGLFEESRGLHSNLGNLHGVAQTELNLGLIARSQGDLGGAREHFAAGLAIQRQIGNSHGVALALGNLGLLALEEGEYERARAELSEALAMEQEMNDRQGMAFSLLNLGLVAQQQGDLDAARDFYTKSLAIRREVGDKQGVALSFHNLAEIAQLQGEYDEARSLYAESLNLFRELNYRPGVLSSLQARSSLAVAAGDFPRAARLLAAAARWRDCLGVPMWPNEREEQERLHATVRDGLDAAAFGALWTEGQQMSLEEAADLATGS
jgi:predicted ATPase/DNA-binding SARP family transcriptional activator/Tfp pilus assembly protein PilF